MTQARAALKTPTEKAPEPELGHERLSKDRYISREYMEREGERMWKRVWLLAGHVDDVAEPGDYFTLSVARESVVVVRDDAGEIRAFRNVCQHRGNLLRRTPRGKIRSLLCPFHLWEWKLDGSLANIPDPETFPQGVPPEKLRLKDVRSEIWAGFVWITLDPNAEPLRDYLGILPEHLDPYHFDRYALAEDYSVEWDCNWKTSVDAFNEAYHSQGIHPQIATYLDDVRIQIDLYDKHTRFLVPMMIPSPRYADQENPNPVLVELAKSVGIDASAYKGRLEDLRRDFQQAKRRALTQAGVDVSDLNDDQLSDDYHYTIFPNISLNILGDELWIFRHWPHPSDPDRMTFDFQIYRPVPEGQARPPRPETQRGQGAQFSLNNEVLDQDARNLPGVQRGMHSEGFEGSWLSDQERRIRHFHHTLDQMLAREP
ncbi:MAG: aromatic ring-hydroxylating dioxygenase subunit alpha [Proteobacteria bacterium]|nr:aromatic ring-hydroxylating dioxygenase subunit alpha [Pseudomonadota bacterium]